MTVIKAKKCPKCVGSGRRKNGDRCKKCEGTGEIIVAKSGGRTNKSKTNN